MYHQCIIIKMMVNENKFAEKEQFTMQKNGKTRSAEHLRILYYYSSQCLFIFETDPETTGIRVLEC
jgi:hypothetical protein